MDTMDILLLIFAGVVGGLLLFALTGPREGGRR